MSSMETLAAGGRAGGYSVHCGLKHHRLPAAISSQVGQAARLAPRRLESPASSSTCRRLTVCVYQAQGTAAPAESRSGGGRPAAASGGGGGGAVGTSCWPCKGGSLVKVLQQGPASSEGPGGEHQLTIVLDSSHSSRGSIPKGATVELHWGVYRSSPHQWQHPEESVPAGSQKDERSGAMRSVMAAAGDGSTHSIRLSMPASLAPLTMAFVVRVTAPPAGADGALTAPKGHFVVPLRGRHFTALIGCSSGSNEQQGATLLPPPAAPPPPAAAAAAIQQQQQHTVNFAVRCRGAERVALVLLRPRMASTVNGGGGGGGGDGGGQQQAQWGMMEIVLDPVLNRTGELWHIAVDGVHDLAGLCYGWRLEGDVSWESGCRVQPDLLLLDPCCSSLRYFPLEAAAGAPVPLPTLTMPDASQLAAASSLEGLIAGLQEQQAAVEAARAASRAARGAAGPAVGGAAASSAAAAAAAAAAGGDFVAGPGHALEDLRLLELDVRTFAQGKGVQHPGSFLGVAERAGHIQAVGANAVVLTPSYATAKGIGLLSRAAVHYMAADPLLCAADSSSSVAAAAEFRQMLSQLHAAGIEVLLQFELTFTAEGTDELPSTLSMRGLDYAAYYRGNGVLNCGNACTRQYLMEVLHHWAAEGVDGFSFVNAENLVQDRHGSVLDAPPLPEAICHDPVLRRLKLVAHPSDNSLLPRNGVRGFPHWGLWQQRNTGFGADLVAYMAEDNPGLLTAMAGRLTGSAAVFDADWDAGLPGDLAAGRRPAFGINSITVLGRQDLAELAREAAALAGAARAAGAAGPAGAAGYGGSAPLPTAATITKSLLAVAVMALGVPIVPQDAVEDLPTAHFVGVLMRLRRRLAPLLLPPRFDSPRDISWHAADLGVEPLWDPEIGVAAAASGARNTNYLGFSVRGAGGQAVYVGMNPHPYPVTAALPPPEAGRVWERIVDTSLPSPDDALMEGGQPVGSPTYTLPSKAVVVMQTAVVETQAWPSNPSTARPADWQPRR